MDAILYKLIGLRIRDARKKLELTQEELGKRVDLTRASIANIEVGRQALPIHVLFKFAQALGLKPFDLIPSEEEIDSTIDTSDSLSADSTVSFDEILWVKSLIDNKKE